MNKYEDLSIGKEFTINNGTKVTCFDVELDLFKTNSFFGRKVDRLITVGEYYESELDSEKMAQSIINHIELDYGLTLSKLELSDLIENEVDENYYNQSESMKCGFIILDTDKFVITNKKTVITSKGTEVVIISAEALRCESYEEKAKKISIAYRKKSNFDRLILTGRKLKKIINWIE